jgi:hypothetical protein
MTDLDEIFNDAPVEPAQEPEAQQVEAEATPETPEPAEATPEAEKPEAVETTATKEEKTETKEAWEYAAYKDEKSKRQEYARENEELKAQLAKLQPRQEPEKAPDPVDDPEGFAAYIQRQADELAESRMLHFTENHMRKTHDDYDEKKAVFIELVKENPQLGEKAKATGDPLGFLYDQATKHQQYQEMQDIDGYKAKIRAEIMAEIEAEKAGETQTIAEKTSNITPSLATATAASANEPELDDSLESMFAGRNY